MQIPQGSKVIFKGGSFVGALPSRCEISDGAALTATSSSSSVVFAEGYATPSGSTLTITGGTLTITTATINGTVDVSNALIAITTSLTVGGSFSYSATLLTIPSLTTTNGASLTLLDGARLSVTTNATIGTTTASGTGYLALPHGTIVSGITQAAGSDVRVCDYGAGVTAFAANKVTASATSLTFVKTNATASVLLEKSTNGTTWTLLSAYASSPFAVQNVSSTDVFRLYDGENFKTCNAAVFNSYYEIAETVGTAWVVAPEAEISVVN